VKDYNATVRIKNLYNEFVAEVLHKDVFAIDNYRLPFIKHKDVFALERFEKDILEKIAPRELKDEWLKNT